MTVSTATDRQKAGSTDGDDMPREAGGRGGVGASAGGRCFWGRLSGILNRSLSPSELRTAVLFLIVAALGALAAWGAIGQMWLCDDAFISYRYARNLVEGRGLVYNAGEYVEGYSNFLWTLWCAVGLRLGVSCETWSIWWGTSFYVLSVLVLGYYSFRVHEAFSPGYLAVPTAAILAAFHEDWGVFASGGLETCAFTFVVLLVFIVLAVEPNLSLRRAAAAGLLASVCALTRPDGVVFAFAGGLYVLWNGRGRKGPAGAYAVAFLGPWASFLAWRVWYYGDFFPNTYYAKSAYLPWWDQGWHYIQLYFRKYAVLLFGIAGLVRIFLVRSRDAGERGRRGDLRRQAVLAMLFGGLFMAYIVQIGGDFMYARMLIPATPFLLIVNELGLLAMSPARPGVRCLVAGLLLAGLIFVPYPDMKRDKGRGVVNERGYYGRLLLEEYGDPDAATLRRYFEGLPVRVAVLGAQAHLAYRGRIPVAIECATGLTDRTIARQSLRSRGRVGHEKPAPMRYLLSRGVHFVIGHYAPVYLNLGSEIPIWLVRFDRVEAYVVHWDPPVMDELRKRGAIFVDCPAEIDRFVGGLNTMSDAEVAALFAKLRAFYFDHVEDPARERAFRERLGMPISER